MQEDKALSLWLQANESQEKSCMATIVQENVQEEYVPLRLCMTESGKIETTIACKQSLAIIKSLVVQKMAEHLGQSEMVEVRLPNDTFVQVFIDMYIPKPNIVIFGAGHDAIPLAMFGHALGFDMTVVDARELYNSIENFPNCRRIIARPDEFTTKVPITAYSYIVIMNHHIEKDRETLQFALQSPAPYVGVLGPRSRREKMMTHLEQEGVTFTEAMLKKMYNPVGLDIGAETPEEIAVSIVSEMIAIQKGHQAGFLHDKHQIHRYASKSAAFLKDM